jgi:4'-phosphopantetheinyl transferase
MEIKTEDRVVTREVGANGKFRGIARSMIARCANGPLEPDSEVDRDSVWKPGPPSLALSSDRVDVWRVSLDMPERERGLLESSLSVAERERASRFRSSVDRARFVAARGALRAILGGCLGVEPSCLRFSFGHFGKPELAGQPGASAVEFSLSHSDGLALVAACLGRRLGVDLERVDVARSERGIAERFFSRREVAALRALPHRLQTDAFFACWTRKEAHLKARGVGLSVPLDRFSVSVSPEDSAALLGSVDDPELNRWALLDLRVGQGWAAALAAEGTEWRSRCWVWQPEVSGSSRSYSKRTAGVGLSG